MLLRPLHPKSRSAARVASWLVALALGACQVNITKQSAVDPCDPNPCTEIGVCAGWTGTCSAETGVAVCSAWQPNGAAPKGADGKPLSVPASYEAIETKCDGQDNDCNGLTDEGVLPPTGTCSAVGVCAGQTLGHAVCNAGTWLCDWNGVAGYEAVEVSCDGKDNDCDGSTDEDVQPPAGACKRAGVCTSLPAPTCTAGAWDCGYGGADYQAVESACDGKDNDCDGIVDANLTVTGLDCLGQGVCAQGVKQVCAGGVPVCDYGGVQGYELFEKSCDGQDNDCDGHTDNLAGSTQALQDKDTTDCANKGVCGANLDKIVRRCENGVFVCNYGAVPKWESPEKSCDAKDNDCDGVTDVGLGTPSISPCPSAGVCAEAKPVCSGGLWMCDWASVATKGYEAFEQSCDGKDNDCDGLTDETVSAKASKCKTAGVCGFGASVSCTAGKPTCDYSHIAGFETTETSCDGQDNDCDGQTDEADALDPGPSGCKQGVCATAVVTCTGGAWQCDTSGLGSDYEAVESKCDGKDNDCDGLTDEGVVDSSACKSKGVCAAGVPTACISAVPMCIYQGVKGYEAAEASCDGLDNNCDGKTDYHVCPPAAPCQTDVDCTTGSCTSVLGGTGKACTVKAKQCAAIGDFGAMVFADDGGTRCLTSKSIATCNNGTWGTPTVCGASLPVCDNGTCVLCTPNAMRCDPADPSKIQQCSADGKSVSAKGSCGVGEHCSGGGACVPEASVLVSDTASAYGGVIAVLGNGKLATAWLTDGGLAASVNVRMFSGSGVPDGVGSPIQGSAAAVKNSQLAIAPVGSGFVVGWVSKNGGDSNIYLRMFDSAGAPIGAPFVANGPNDIGGEQTEPVLLGNGSGFVAAWTSDSFEGSGSKGVVVQRFDATGAAATDPVLANLDESGQTLDDTVNGDQSQAAMALRADGGFLVVWQHANGPQELRIRSRLFNAAGTPTGAVGALSAATGTANHPAVAAYAKGFAVVWSASGIDGAGAGVALRLTDAQGVVQGAVTTVNTFTPGDQVDVTIAAAATGGALLGWTSPEAISAAKGLEVASRALEGDGSFVDTESVVTAGEATGDQSVPRLVAFTDGRFGWLYRFRATASDPLQLRLLLP